MSDKRAIGLFDSGVGGLSIWKEINELLPREHTVYLADSANAPYGRRSKEQIIALCKKNTELLIDKGCKLIVVACNTATTNAIKYLREHYDVPFIGIEPAIKPAAVQTKTKVIGVLATKGTLSSKLFHNTSELYTEGIEMIEQIGTGLVELIESGRGDSQEMKDLLQQYLEPMVERNIDYLVLGCTHYPFLIPQIKALVPLNIKIIDSGAAVAKQVYRVLLNKDMLNVESDSSMTQHKFYNNVDVGVMQQLVPASYEVSFLKF